MKFVERNFDGVNLLVPDHPDFFFPVQTFKGFPTCCGAGKSGDKFVPDTLLGLSISVACWIHDRCFSTMRHTWKNFYLANLIFYKNATRINTAHSDSCTVMFARQAMITAYTAGVNTLVGAYNFFKGKKQ